MLAEQVENGRHTLTKPRGGFFMYQRVSGKAHIAATSKLDQAFRANGGLKQLNMIARQHKYSSNGGRNDPSIFVLLEKLMGDVIGKSSL